MEGIGKLGEKVGNSGAREKEGELSLSGNAVGFLGSAGGPLEVHGHELKVRLPAARCIPPPVVLPSSSTTTFGCSGQL